MNVPVWSTSVAFGNEEIPSHRLIPWSRGLIFRLIDAFRDEPILWNPKHPSFKSRAKKKAALGRIAEDLGLPLPAVRQKIDVLKGTFQKYRRAIQARGDEQPYKMWFAYERLMFLAPDYQDFNAPNAVCVTANGEEATYTITYNAEEEGSQKETTPSARAYVPPPSVQAERSQTVQGKQSPVKGEDTNSTKEHTWPNVLASTVRVMVRQAGPRPEPEMWRLQDSLVELLRRFHNGEFAEERLDEWSEKSTQ